MTMTGLLYLAPSNDGGSQLTLVFDFFDYDDGTLSLAPSNGGGGSQLAQEL
jgi:hypothetical protein